MRGLYPARAPGQQRLWLRSGLSLPADGSKLCRDPGGREKPDKHRGHALAEVAAEATKIATWLKHRLLEVKPPKPDHKEFANNDWSEGK